MGCSIDYNAIAAAGNFLAGSGVFFLGVIIIIRRNQLGDGARLILLLFATYLLIAGVERMLIAFERFIGDLPAPEPNVYFVTIVVCRASVGVIIWVINMYLIFTDIQPIEKGD